MAADIIHLVGLEILDDPTRDLPENKRTLLQCARVCRSWGEIFSALIWRDIEIDDENMFQPPTSTQARLRKIQRNSDKILKLAIFWDMPAPATTSSAHVGSTIDTKKLEALHLILRWCRHLTHLALDLLVPPSAYRSPPVEAAIYGIAVAVLSLPGLRRLKCDNLTTTRLGRALFLPAPRRQHQTSHATEHVMHLQIPPRPLSSLRSLELDLRSQPMTPLTLLTHLRTALRSLGHIDLLLSRRTLTPLASLTADPATGARQAHENLSDVIVRVDLRPGSLAHPAVALGLSALMDTVIAGPRVRGVRVESFVSEEMLSMIVARCSRTVQRLSLGVVDWRMGLAKLEKALVGCGVLEWLRVHFAGREVRVPAELVEDKGAGVDAAVKSALAELWSLGRGGE
ncbi:hypothetical protein HK101_002393, partial [Irineochytrium annulatum]